MIMKSVGTAGAERGARAFPVTSTEVRESMINFVKIIFIFTFLPIGTTDQLGNKPLQIQNNYKIYRAISVVNDSFFYIIFRLRYCRSEVRHK